MAITREMLFPLAFYKKTKFLNLIFQKGKEAFTKEVYQPMYWSG